MATTVAEATGAHVPARKKLRLGPASTSTVADTETREDATERKDRKDKKRKKKVSSEEGDGDEAQTIPSEKATKRHKKRRRDQDAPVSPAGREEEKALKDEKSTSKTPRKSVAFATDVKSGDNDGAQPDPTEADESVDYDDDDDDDDNTQEGTREEKLQRKREKREQRRRDATGKKASPAAPLTSTGDDGAPYEAPVLSYLRQYYEDRSSWKFQKNRETHLLKHILSLEQLPSRYNRALLAYLQGLKSEGARQRLRITAQGAIRSDEEKKGEEQVVSGDDPEHKDRDGEVGTEDSNAGLATAPTGSDETLEKSQRDSYAQAIQAFRANLVAGTRDLDEASVLDSTPVDARNRLERRQRAELVLWAVNGKISRASSSAIQAGQRSGPDGGDGYSPNATVKANQDVLAEKSSATNIKKDNAPKKKKRKNRTVVVEISSSSESSSDSEASAG
jgi:20S proteasome subunit alpha 1